MPNYGVKRFDWGGYVEDEYGENDDSWWDPNIDSGITFPDVSNDPFGGDNPVVEQPPYTPGEDASQFPGGSGGAGNQPSVDFREMFRKLLVNPDKSINLAGLAGIGGLLGLLNRGTGGAQTAGYQGTIPKYTAVRERVPIVADPNRRPGAGGRRYFSDTAYVPQVADTATNAGAINAVRELAKQQAASFKQPAYSSPVATTGGVSTLPTSNLDPRLIQTLSGLPSGSQYEASDKELERLGLPVRSEQKGQLPYETTDGDLMARVRSLNPNLDWSKYNPNKMTMDYDQFDEARDRFIRNARAEVSGNVQPETKLAAQGGLMNLAKGRYLNGATDGMADKIPANIEGSQPAALSHGEFVIPADVVSHLGNGNSEAGAQRLYDMMDRIRKARTGTTKQGKQINPDKFMPK